MKYKGYCIWHNDLQGWMVQSGYSILHVSLSLRGAKQWVTLNINKGNL